MKEHRLFTKQTLGILFIMLCVIHAFSMWSISIFAVYHCLNINSMVLCQLTFYKLNNNMPTTSIMQYDMNNTFFMIVIKATWSS